MVSLDVAGWGLGLLSGAYLLGSVSFAVLVSRMMGLADPRSYGSGNPGATNVLRSGRRLAAGLTLLGDAGKGVLAVWMAREGAVHAGLPDAWVVWAGLAAFVGHVYPILFNFKGGKGVATAAGVLLALAPTVGGGVLLIWLAVVLTSRYVSLASVVAAGAAPFIAWWAGPNPAALWPVALMSVILIGRHRTNLAKLRAGHEHRLGQARAEASI